MRERSNNDKHGMYQRLTHTYTQTDLADAKLPFGSVGLISERETLKNRFKTVLGKVLLRNARFWPYTQIWQLLSLAESKISECTSKF